MTLKDIIKVVDKANVSNNVMNKLEKDQKAESPGMKYRHYAPKTKCLLVCGNEQEQINKINEICITKKVCVLGFCEDESKINANNFISMGSRSNLEEVAKNLFISLREADKTDNELILIEGTEEKDIGLAIMNRLIRTCEYNVI